MNDLFQFIWDKFAPKSQDAILLKACRDGDPHAAQVALKNGANPNIPTNLGSYTYSLWQYEPQYTGTVQVMPILLTATSANGKDEDRYYQVIQLLLNHPNTDLEKVAFGHKKEWRSEQHHDEGYPPIYEEDYHYSLRQVAMNYAGGSIQQQPSKPSDLYPISQEMALFLQAALSDSQGKNLGISSSVLRKEQPSR